MIQVIRLYKIKETPMKAQEAPTKQETIPHLALRRQWLDDIEKDPKCAWRGKVRGSLVDWSEFAPGLQPSWYADWEYSPLPKTKTVYMILVKHKNHKGLPPFPLLFNSLTDIPEYLNNFNLVQLGEVVNREVEQ